jgi:hypothetical protein
MQGLRARADALPNANSPQLLTHLLETVARGVRSVQGLEEALGVDRRTVLYYLQAGEWLGLLTGEDPPLLSPEGLGYVYGGVQRARLYSRAVAHQPFVRELLARSGGRSPSAVALEGAIAAADPTLAAATVKRRASAVRGLIAPLFDQEATELHSPSNQLLLPLAQAPLVEPVATLAPTAGRSFSPDVYRYLLCFLLDHGELSLGHVRGLLDRAGAAEVPVGGYVDLALARQDAVRIDERLVVTSGAIARRDLASSTKAIILSDHGWRDHLDAVRKTLAEATSTFRVEGRYRRWNDRLFGRALSAATLDADLERVLRDRSLSAWPRTDTTPPAPINAQTAAFLDLWEQPHLLIALPPSLVQLWEGLTGVNRRLRNARHRTDAVGSPTVAYRPVAAHGGLLHPGEQLPRSIPDTRTLRQRLVQHSPYVAMLVSLLLDHRARATSVELAREQGVWCVRRHRRNLGELLAVLDGFARERGWHPSRRGHGGTSDAVLLTMLERLGLVVLVGDRAVLDDTFFRQLRGDDEEQVLHSALAPLGAALATYLDRLHGEASREPK